MVKPFSLMTALPIVSRELRLVARRPSTYWTRFGVAICACIAGAYAMMFATQTNMGVMAKQMLYSTISSVVGIYALFSGMRNTADNISSEKRDGTLGLLFLTDLKGYDVVLGKLCSTAIHSFYGMLAAFPVLGIALIGGGITGAEFFRGALALLNVIFFAHALGLVISAYSLNSRRALGCAIFIGFLLMWGLPVMTWLLTGYRWPRTSEWVGHLSPLNALNMGVSSMPGVRGPMAVGGGVAPFVAANSFWRALLVSHLLGWAFVLVASLHVPRCWQNIDVKLPWRTRLQSLWHGSIESRTKFRRKLIGINPFFWLASRTRFDPLMTMVILVVATVAIVWMFLRTGAPLMPLSIVLMLTLHLIVRVNISGSASRHFSEQRRSGALEFLLACTPLTPKDLIRGQWLALRRQFLVPLVFILLTDLFLMVVVTISDANTTAISRSEDLIAYNAFSVGMIVVLLCDCITLGWVGMWMGISHQRPNRAASAASTRVLVWPFLATFFIGTQIGFRANSLYSVLATWILISLVCDAIFFVHARKSLDEKFRELAATPYEEQSGIMASIGRALGKATRPHVQADPGEAPPLLR
jgi:ABC-type transport system involved in cytochrome c biogenesis permease component